MHLVTHVQARWAALSIVAVVSVAVIGCRGGSEDDIGSTYVTSKAISAVEGGSVEVTASEDAVLAGTRVDIPPGALSEDTVISIAPGLDDIANDGASPAGPVVRFGPEGTRFEGAAVVTLPYDGSALIAIQVRAADGTTSTIDPEAVMQDGAARTVAFEVAGLAELQPSRVDTTGEVCGNRADDNGNAYIDEGCRPGPE